MIETNSHNKFLDLVTKRQSVRAYLPETVEIERILLCIEAARLAPSACNAQPWTFIVVNDKEEKNKLADLTANRLLPLNHFTKQAPVHIVIVVEAGNLTAKMGSVIKKKDFSWIDLGIAAEHFCLQAAEIGLGTCMLGWFKEEKVKELLAIPSQKRVGLIITLGYPASETIRPKQRKSLEKIIRWNSYA